MNESQVYFFDTNVVVDWLYKEVSPHGDLLKRFVDSLKKDQCAVFGVTLTEIETIINDAYNVMAHMIHEEVLSKTDWDSLSAEERLRTLNEIKKEFEEKYEEIRERYYRGRIRRSEVRLLLAKRFFTDLGERLVELGGEDVRRHFSLTQRPRDIIDYVRSVKSRVADKCTIVYDIGKPAIEDDITARKKELLSKGIENYIKKLKEKGYKKSPSRTDTMIFTNLYLLIDKNVYPKVVFVTDDVDFKGMYESVIEYLNEVASRGGKEGDSLTSYAIEVREALVNRLSIMSVSEVLASYSNK